MNRIVKGVLKLNLYDKYWKVLMLLPVALLVISSFVLVSNIITTGSFMERDIELSGGKEISMQVSNVDTQKLSLLIPYATIHTTQGEKNTLLVEFPFDKNESEVLSILNSNGIQGDYSLRSIGPSLGDVFFQQAQISIILAFVLMAITVFGIFRSPAPSFIVILAAATDIISTMAIISILGVKLSMPVLAALLTIIGYSVDTDIVLTNELLKNKHTDKKEGIKRAAKTGITMSLTALAAMTALYFVSGSFILEQIAFVLIVGILIDIPATWFTNAGVLRLWLEKKEKV